MGVAGLDRRVLLAHSLGCEVSEVLLSEPCLSEGQEKRFFEFLERREGGEPVSRIIGRREFFSLEFGLSPSVLDPRPDSELLVEIAVGLKPKRILDMGVGSGCLLLACLYHLPEAYGVGVDVCGSALEQAGGNAERLCLGGRVRFLRSDWFAGVEGEYELILCNPPYIESGVISSLQEEVKGYDPLLALDGGKDGLDGFRAVLAQSGGVLAEGGRLVLEMGVGQKKAVSDMAGGLGWEVVRVEKDLAGRERAIVLKKTFDK